MSRTIGPVPRLAALSVAVTLLASTVASAQSISPAPSLGSPKTALLSPTAFARLVRTQLAVAPQPVAKDSLRSRLRLVTAALAPQTQTTPVGTPQRSWASRHKVGLVLIGVAAAGGITAFAIARCCLG